MMDALTWCGCSNTADRLSTTGNACDVPWRFHYGQLNRTGMSYQTCMFGLLLANRFPLRSDREKLYAQSALFDAWFKNHHIFYSAD